MTINEIKDKSAQELKFKDFAQFEEMALSGELSFSHIINLIDMVSIISQKEALDIARIMIVKNMDKPSERNA